MALKLGSGKRRWVPAKNLRRGGEVEKDEVMSYLEKVAREFKTPESVELLCAAAPRGSGDEKGGNAVAMLISVWQLELMEAFGWEQDFGRNVLCLWSQERTEGDLELQSKFVGVQEAAEGIVRTAAQEAQMRRVLHLGTYDPTTPEAADCIVPRRTPLREGASLDSLGPVPRDLVLKYCKDAVQLLLSNDTRVGIAELVSTYTTWGSEQRQTLLQCALTKWQLDVWEDLGVDRRLGNIEVHTLEGRFTNDTEIGTAWARLVAVHSMVEIWAFAQPPKLRRPKPAGSEERRIMPHAELAAAGLAAPPGGAEAPLLEEGRVPMPAMLAYLRRLAELSDGEWSQAVYERAAAGDVFATERWRNELLEGFGMQFEYGGLLVQLIGTGIDVWEGGSEAMEQEMLEARKGIEESAPRLKAQVEAGLRSRAAAKAKAKA